MGKGAKAQCGGRPRPCVWNYSLQGTFSAAERVCKGHSQLLIHLQEVVTELEVQA